MSEIMTKEEIQKQLNSMYMRINELEKEYISLASEYEKRKIKIVDPTIRDSIEKQLLKVAKEDESFCDLEIKVNELRREREFLYKKIDILRELIKILSL
jgi:hypothetical protein